MTLLCIEKSAFRKGEYVGYCAGYVLRITKTNSSYGNWTAQFPHIPTNPRQSSALVYGMTLAKLDAKLADMARAIKAVAVAVAVAGVDA